MRTSLTAGRLIRPARVRAEGDCRRNGHDAAVILTDDLPAAFVHHPVMPVAEQSEFGRFISTPMEPVHDMLAPAPACRPLTTRPAPVFFPPLTTLSPPSPHLPLSPSTRSHS